MPPSGAAMWGEARGRGAKPLGMPGGSAEGAGRRPRGPERAGGAKPQEAAQFLSAKPRPKLSTGGGLKTG